MNTTITDIQYHRNGISGNGFHVILFRWADRDMVATVFESPSHIAVLDVKLAAEGNVKPEVNSWRGDDFESDLRHYIKVWDESPRQITARGK